MKDFSKFTQILLDKMPYWFKMKKNPKESSGALFMNYFGLELEDINNILEYAQKQMFIDTCDIKQVDILYKGHLKESIQSIDDIMVYGDGFEIKVYSNAKDFLHTTYNENNYSSIFSTDGAYVDIENNMIYLSKPYGKDEVNKYGSIKIIGQNGDYTIKTELHHVWNFFDEFGYLLSCPRLEEESNYFYKQRLLDIFKHVANSSRTGLMNGIARELNLRKNEIWENGANDYIIKSPMVVVNSISIDGIHIPENEVFKNEYGEVLLKGDEMYENEIRHISYVAGIEMHSLSNKSDEFLQQQLFDVDNRGTELLKYYIDNISSITPILWNKWRWDVDRWDIADIQYSGSAVMPSKYDSSIEGFVNNGL